MEDKQYFNILSYKLKKKENIEITVLGDSMYPNLISGDIITIKKTQSYSLGDIVVFLYENQALLVHRLIIKLNGYFYCKGDNTFRLEKISPKQILGIVNKIERSGEMINVPNVPKNFIRHSYQVNQEFCRLNFNRDKLLKSDIYVSYRNKYLKPPDNN